MKSFHRPVRTALLLITAIICFCFGCQSKVDDIDAFGKTKDVTEDLHHRLKAGIFKPGIDPFVCQILKPTSIFNFRATFRLGPRLKFQAVPRQKVRLSWDRGAFHIESDDQARVVIYMDEESTFSHVQIAPRKGLGLGVQFREINKRPFR
jgi:hypothetical protein